MVDLLAIRLSCHVSTSTLDAVRIATERSRTATDCMFLTLYKLVLVLVELIHFAGATSAPEVILDQDTVLGVVIANRLLTFQIRSIYLFIFQIRIHIRVIYLLEHVLWLISVSIILNELISGVIKRSLFYIYLSICHSSLLAMIWCLIQYLGLAIFLHIHEHASLLCCLVVANGLVISFFMIFKISYIRLHLFQENQTKGQK